MIQGRHLFWNSLFSTQCHQQVQKQTNHVDQGPVMWVTGCSTHEANWVSRLHIFSVSVLFCIVFPAKFVNIRTSKCKCIFNDILSKKFLFLKAVGTNCVPYVHGYSTFTISHGGHGNISDHSDTKKHKAAIGVTSSKYETHLIGSWMTDGENTHILHIHTVHFIELQCLCDDDETVYKTTPAWQHFSCCYYWLYWYLSKCICLWKHFY